MNTEVLKMVIDAVGNIGELGVWGLVAYLVTTMLLAIIQYGTLLLIMYWVINGIRAAIAHRSAPFSEAQMKRIRDHYRLGLPGTLTDDEKYRVEAKIREIVREDMKTQE